MQIHGSFGSRMRPVARRPERLRADKRMPPAEPTRPTSPPFGSTPSTTSFRWKPPRRLRPRGSTASPPLPSTRRWCRARLHNRSLVGQLNGLASAPQPKKHGNYHWPTVANAALARTIRGIFPSLNPANLTAINALEQNFAAQFQAEVKRQDYQRSVAQGQGVAETILAWAATDGLLDGQQLSSYYVPIPCPAPGSRRRPSSPTPYSPAGGSSGRWSSTQGPSAPPQVTRVLRQPRSAFYAAALEVYHTGLTLTAEQQAIAHYWADWGGSDGHAPGHWIAIVGQIARPMACPGSGGRGVCEARHCRHGCLHRGWQAKYLDNLQRPVTYIQDYIDAPGGRTS